MVPSIFKFLHLFIYSASIYWALTRTPYCSSG
jgi:hypothetical protein